MNNDATTCEICNIGHNKLNEGKDCEPSILHCTKMINNSADKCENCSIEYSVSGDKKSCEAKVSNC